MISLIDDYDSSEVAVRSHHLPRPENHRKLHSVLVIKGGLLENSLVNVISIDKPPF